MFITRWLRRELNRKAAPAPAPKHFPYIPKHPVILAAHGPGVPVLYHTMIPLPVASSVGAACRDGIEPLGWVPLLVTGCRS